MGGWNKKTISLKDHILENVFLIPESGCWLWMLGINEKWYGISNIPGKRKTISAHRAAYQELIGTIPYQMHVLHRCDVPSCCNPHHLMIGSNLDNMRDKCKKGRHRNKYSGKLFQNKNP